jgi:hypothetical protein
MRRVPAHITQQEHQFSSTTIADYGRYQILPSVKLKYVICEIFLLLNDLCNVCSSHAAPLGVCGYSYVKVTCRCVETQIEESL